jgi:hypothetical protein
MKIVQNVADNLRMEIEPISDTQILGNLFIWVIAAPIF